MAAKQPKKQNVGFWSLVVIIFSNVGTGPAALEGIIGSAGITLGIIGMIVFPFFWGYVQAFLSAEMCLQYQTINGGLPAWCLRQNNRALAFNTAVWMIAIEASTAALVSEATVAYLQTVWPSFHAYGPRLGLSILIIIVSFVVNYVSINFVAAVFKALSVFTIVVFAILVGYSVPSIDWSRGVDTSFTKDYKSIDYALLVNLLIFNSAGFDAGSSIISYVDDPRKTVPAAMLGVGFASTALYIVTLFFPYIASRDAREDWQAGHLGTVALFLGGRSLQVMVIFACAFVNLQIYSVSLQTAAYTVASMSEHNIFPTEVGFKRLKLNLTRRTPRGTPSHALVLCCALSTVFALAPFVVNLAIGSVLYGAVMIVQVVCIMLLDRNTATIFVPQKRAWRLVLIAIPITLASWTISTQQSMVLFAMSTAIALIGFLSLALNFEELVDKSTSEPSLQGSGSDDVRKRQARALSIDL
jgi:amino acid transporter